MSELPKTNLLVVTVLQIKTIANAYLRLGFVFGLFHSDFLFSLVLLNQYTSSAYMFLLSLEQFENEIDDFQLITILIFSVTK